MHAIERALLILTAGLLCVCGPVLAQAGDDTLVLLAEDDWYPYAAAVDGEPRGISVDLVRAAYGAVGVDVEFRLASYSRCMELVNQGRFIGCFNTPVGDSALENQLLPEEALDRNPAWIYTRAGNDTAVDELGDLHGKPIGIVNGYRYADQFMADPALLREAAGSDLQNMKKLAAGRIEYVVLYERVAEWLMGRYGEEMGLELRPVLKVGELALFVSFSRQHPGAREAMTQLDEGLRRIKRNGEYRRIMAEWEDRLAGGG